MTGIDADLAQIEDLCRKVRPQDAEDKMRALLASLPLSELTALQGRLRDTITSAFLKKRRLILTSVLDERLAAPHPPPAAATESSPPGPEISRSKIVPPMLPSPKPTDLAPAGEQPGSRRLAESEVVDRLRDFSDVLKDLSDHHIFQWSTYYRDWLAEDFDWFLLAGERYSDYQAMLEQVGGQLRSHAREIFEKGYRYQAEQGENTTYILSKSLKGLQRFLDLPIEFYSAKLPSATNVPRARRLRLLNSCMLAGILCGYADVAFGASPGSRVLLQNPKSWVHTLAFLGGSDVHTLLQQFERNDFIRGVISNIVPVVEAFDELGNKREHMPLPAVSQLLWNAGGINIWLRPSAIVPHSQMIELQCYVGEDFIDSGNLVEAAERGVTVLVAPLRPELRTMVQKQERLHGMVVATRADDLTDISETRRAVHGLLVRRAFRQGISSVLSQPLQSNLARAFPLDQPDLLRYFRVRRQSVRDLLRAFEARSGVRLWCSVRRSGKTTAGADLATTTGEATVVSQTCDTTGQSPNDWVFYDKVVTALSDGRQLAATFLMDLVKHCADVQSANSTRYVFVLDEYETLFGQLRAQLERDYNLRYTVVQPLLNQMVAFARDNLLIFIGQQPNAHYLLMDQNQLAPHVRQDHFPLFQHESGEPHEEFAQLVQKVVTTQMEPDPSFVGAIFAETAGHPFLTVNLLADFVDWLIDNGRRLSQLRLTAEDMQQFTDAMLRPGHIATGRDYVLFREAAVEAMGRFGRIHTPWLSAVYSGISEIVKASPDTLSCSRADFAEMVRRAQGEGGIDAELLLSSASESNFLSYDDHVVRPKIRLLGRIAAVSVGSVKA
jgi:hypothetical protein